MNWFYRAVGLVALSNARLSHIRVNLIPLNLALIGGLAALFVLSMMELQQTIFAGSNMTDTAKRVTTSSSAGSYVSVDGFLHPENAPCICTAQQGCSEME